MRINTFSLQESNNNMEIKSDMLPQGLEEGDKVSVKVLSAGNGTAQLRTSEGYILRARLEGDITLTPGKEAVLVVTGKTDGMLYMAIETEQVLSGGEGAPSIVRAGGEDAAIARELLAHGFPVSEENLQLARQIISNTGIAANVAAFFAGSGIGSPDGGMLAAALSLLSGEVNTAGMLDELSDMLSGTLPDAIPDGSETDNDAAEVKILPESAEPESALPEAAPKTWSGLLTALARQASEGETGVQPRLNERAPDTAPADNPETAEKLTSEAKTQAVGVNLQMPETETGITDAQPQIKDQPLETKSWEPEIPVADENSVPRQAPHTGAHQADAPTDKAHKTPETDSRAEINAQSMEEGRSARSLKNPEAGTQRAVFDLLRQMPEFRNVPDRNLSSLTRSLMSAAEDAVNSDTENRHEALLKMVDDMFARLDPEGDMAEGLKRAKEELTVRLSFFKDAVAESGISDKARLAEQTQKLMDHTRLLDSIDRFIYVQIPVKLNDERKNAELYIYKQKKGGGKIDPENVRILLAIDLTNMGRLESLISIRGKDVSVNMETEGEEYAAFFRQNTTVLHKLLAEAGFRLADTHISQKKDGEAETFVSAALAKLSGFESHASRINFTI